MSSERINFFGLAEEKMIYDERKKRFVSTKDIPSHIDRSYNNAFKDVSESQSFLPILIYSNDPIFSANKRENST